jgi:transmembrane sensor
VTRESYSLSEAKSSCDTNASAARWLVRQHTSLEWRDTDQAAFDNWLTESPANITAYWRLEAAWVRADRLAALRGQFPDTDGQGRYGRIVSAIWSGVAVFVVLALVLVGADIYLRSTKTFTYATALGGQKTIKLADGSKIELNTNTSVRFATNGASREVWFDRGEAYFEIKHNAVHPFVVIVDNRRIVDMGTAFSVRHDSGELQVVLTQGRARLESIENAHGKAVVLIPGDIALASGNLISLIHKPSAKVADMLAWRQGLLAFDNTPLSDVAAEFNRYNREKLVVVGSNVRDIGVGGHFRAMNVEAFKRIAHNVLGLHVESRGDETIISR